MTYLISIQTDNAAFEDPEELPRILTELAERARAGEILNGQTIRDSNGNKVGNVFELKRAA